jgi:TonB family protein
MGSWSASCKTEFIVQHYRRNCVASRVLARWAAVSLLSIVGVAAGSAPAWGQEQEIARKLKTKVPPAYPELARRMNIAGVVRVQITVDKSGAVKNSKLVGGHPILANAAMDAVRRWRYESGAEETTGVVEFRFDPAQ